MKIFVTGGTGKVGSRLIPYLIKHGHQIKALVRNPQKAEKLANSGAELVVGDLLKDELTNQLGGCDAVIHVAAQFRGNVSDEQQNDINFKATLNLANSAILAGVKRFVFASTSNVYRGKTNLLGRPWRETDELGPAIAAYPETKIKAEKALTQLNQEGKLEVRILRLGFVYGAGDQHLTETIPYMTGFNPQMKLSLIHHDDVDQAFMLAATTANLNDSNPIFNVVDEEPLTVVDLLKLVGAQPQPTSELSSAALETGEYEMALDNTKIKNKLGFKPIFPNFYTAQNADRL